MRASPRLPRLTSAEFIDWAMRQPGGRYELVDGEIVAMAPQRITHLRVKAAAHRAFQDAIAAAGLPCEALPDGATVVIDNGHAFEPYVTVRCGERLDGEQVNVPDPLILVEVVSPSSRGTDAGKKLSEYFRLASVRHYLIVDPGRRLVTHHRRDDAGRIATMIVPDGGQLALEPPGLTVGVGAFFASI